MKIGDKQMFGKVRDRKFYQIETYKRVATPIPFVY